MTDALPTSTDTRDALHHVAVHIVARARHQRTGRFSLRVTPGGIGTPDLDADARRVRIAGGALVVEHDRAGGPAVTAIAIDGARLRDLAGVAGVDLDAPLDVGHDTPPLGDIDRVMRIDADAADSLGATYARFARVLDRVVLSAAAGPLAAPVTLPRVWPEHFDVAIEVERRQGRRVNLGASPGDGFCAEPYWYVGPWSADRPGGPGFWNAPFGAFVPLSAVDDDDALAFLVEGLDRAS